MNFVTTASNWSGVKGLTVVAKFEREYVESIMARTHGNLAESARLAGMDRANFRRLARRNDIDLERLRLD